MHVTAEREGGGENEEKNVSEGQNSSAFLFPITQIEILKGESKNDSERKKEVFLLLTNEKPEEEHCGFRRSVLKV